MTAPQNERIAPRWGAALIVVCIAALIALLPRRYSLVPTSFAYIGAALMVVPMILGPLTRRRYGLSRRVERAIEFFAVGTALFFNSCNLLVAAYNLIENPGTLEPVTLFYTSVGIWFGNILIFTLIYWLVDDGGPDARLNREAHYPDFDFPAMDEGAPVRPGWRPGIIDYLFLAFTTNTAFSPTEAMPMTARAKVLVMLQSSISLITIAIVAARTINILK